MKRRDDSSIESRGYGGVPYPHFGLNLGPIDFIIVKNSTCLLYRGFVSSQKEEVHDFAFSLLFASVAVELGS